MCNNRLLSLKTIGLIALGKSQSRLAGRTLRQVKMVIAQEVQLHQQMSEKPRALGEPPLFRNPAPTIAV